MGLVDLICILLPVPMVSLICNQGNHHHVPKTTIFVGDIDRSGMKAAGNRKGCIGLPHTLQKALQPVLLT